VYAMPETGIGFFTDVGGSYFLSRVHHNIHYGLYLAITGHRLKGRDLVKFGVATHFVPHENINQLKDSLIKNSNVQITDDEIIRIIDSMSDK
jgi:3-hydroxyisobutyryl-CoA hydrolase